MTDHTLRNLVAACKPQSAAPEPICDGQEIDDRIQELLDRRNAEATALEATIVKYVADGRFEVRIAQKVARAYRMGYLTMSSIMDVLDSLGQARTRGAYAVAGFKRVFREAGLSWLEEEWPI